MQVVIVDFEHNSCLFLGFQLWRAPVGDNFLRGGLWLYNEVWSSVHFEVPWRQRTQAALPHYSEHYFILRSRAITTLTRSQSRAESLNRTSSNEPCGHLRLVTCYWKEAAPCDESAPKSLPCEHVVESRCSVSPEEVSCPVEVPHQFACSHSKLVPCGTLSTADVKYLFHAVSMREALNAMRCASRAAVVRSSRIGEMSLTGRYQSSAFSSLQRGNRKELKCGHHVTLPCATSVHDSKCKSSVSVKLDCNHEIEKICLFEKSCWL